MSERQERAQSDSEGRKRAPRDPEGRKRAIVKAAAALMEREGTQRTTHRRIAEEAGVPLGSTTQYFSSIEELRRAGLAELARQIEEDYDEMFRAVAAGGGDADAFADELVAYLGNTERVNIDAAFYAAAVHDPEIKALSRQAFANTVERACSFMDRRQAVALAVVMDGFTLDTNLQGGTDEDVVRFAVHAIMDAREENPDDRAH